MCSIIYDFDKLHVIIFIALVKLASPRAHDRKVVGSNPDQNINVFRIYALPRGLSLLMALCKDSVFHNA